MYAAIGSLEKQIEPADELWMSGGLAYGPHFRGGNNRADSKINLRLNE